LIVTIANIVSLYFRGHDRPSARLQPE